MQKGRMLAVITATSVLMGALGLQAWSSPQDSASLNQPVLLKNGTLYMTTDRTGINPTAQQIDGTSRSLFVVQFTGPVKEAYKSALVRLGAELGDYLPENAFLVRMDASLRGQVSALGYVKGVAPYTPSYKIDGSLSNVAAGSPTTVRITTFGPGTKGPVGALATMGVHPDSIGMGMLTAKLDADGLKSLAQSTDVVYLEAAPANQLFNEKAAVIMGAAPVWKNGLDGKGQVVAITDTGLDTGKNDRSMHPDFQGQIKSLFALGKPGDASDKLAHGTHVAGSVLGTGAASNGQHKGLAPGASLVFQSVEDNKGSLGGIPEDLTKLFRQAYDAGARIHTNSWGVPATSGGTVYNAQSAAVDRFMWENPDYTILFAAGNDGDHDQDGRPNYGTVSTPGTAKNAITIGASHNDRPERKMATNPGEIAVFSSRGPTKDNRVKPDLVAPGTWIASARSSLAEDKHFWAAHESNQQYGYMGGTSMATPLTAGGTAVLRQFYVDTLEVTPRASLLKATLINGAAPMDAGQTVKDAGWGRVDLSNILSTRPFKFVNEEKPLPTGEAQTYSYEVKTGQPLKVTLAWTDYPANPAAEKTLVNDLDLIVKGPDGKEVMGNHMLGADVDRTNNVENVVIATPTTGTYSVTVRAHNVPQGPQRFALVVSGNVEGGASQPTPPPEDPKPNPPKKDTEAPKAAVSSPLDGSTVSGIVPITVNATDNVGVTKVIFYADGKEVGTTATAPFVLDWDSTSVSDGVRSLVANAYDAAGNVGISKAVKVTVQNQNANAVGEIQFTGKVGNYGTARRFQVDVKAPGTVKAQLALSAWSNVTLMATDPNGRQVATGQDGLSFQAATSGTYTIMLVSYGGWADFALKVTYPPADGTKVSSHSGVLSAAGQRSAVHTITMSKPGSLNAILTANDARADFDLYLVDTWGRVLTQATSPNLNPETLSARLGAGTYSLYVVADSGQASYQLQVVHPQ
jgi:serine protease AprX